MRWARWRMLASELAAVLRTEHTSSLVQQIVNAIDLGSDMRQLRDIMRLLRSEADLHHRRVETEDDAKGKETNELPILISCCRCAIPPGLT